MTPRIVIDTREPWPHPWAQYLTGAELTQGTLETGDFALAGAERGAVVERKTVPDFLACIGRERTRFDKELLRARYLQSFCIVVEGTLVEVLHEASGLHPNAIVGSVAAWARRGFPVVFAGSARLAAALTQRFLGQQITEAQRILSAHPGCNRYNPDTGIAPGAPCIPPVRNLFEPDRKTQGFGRPPAIHP